MFQSLERERVARAERALLLTTPTGAEGAIAFGNLGEESLNVLHAPPRPAGKRNRLHRELTWEGVYPPAPPPPPPRAP